MNSNFITRILTFLIIGLLGCIVAFGIESYKNINTENVIVDSQYGIIEKKEDIATPQIVEQPLDNISDTFSTNVDYQNSASKTRYFYNQLDSNSKIIYDGISSNIDNMKSGTYKIEFGDKFSSILSKENGQKELGDYYQSAIEAFTYDNPGVFFLAPTKMYLNIRTTTKGNKKTYSVCISSAENSNYLAQGFESVEQINQAQSAMEKIKAEIASKISTYNTEKKIKYIHDYLVDNLSYDQTISKNNIYNIYGALINKECVCEGYAKAFKYLLDEAGVDSVIVSGTGTNSEGKTENHAWNYVAIDGVWYAVDVTWDDPLIQGAGVLFSSSYKYKYYLKGEFTIGKDHIQNGQFTTGGMIFKFPELSNHDY